MFLMKKRQNVFRLRQNKGEVDWNSTDTLILWPYPVSAYSCLPRPANYFDAHPARLVLLLSIGCDSITAHPAPVFNSGCCGWESIFTFWDIIFCMCLYFLFLEGFSRSCLSLFYACVFINLYVCKLMYVVVIKVL